MACVWSGLILAVTALSAQPASGVQAQQGMWMQAHGRKPKPDCHAWCDSNINSWMRKCTWKKCKGCDFCPGPFKVPMRTIVNGNATEAAKTSFWVVSAGSYIGRRTMASGMSGKTAICVGSESSAVTGVDMGITCCNDAGKGSRPHCKRGTYSDAVQHCESLGLELCTADQLKEGAGESTGCDFDRHLVWSSTPCIQAAAEEVAAYKSAKAGSKAMNAAVQRAVKDAKTLTAQEKAEVEMSAAWHFANEKSKPPDPLQTQADKAFAKLKDAAQIAGAVKAVEKLKAEIKKARQ